MKIPFLLLFSVFTLCFALSAAERAPMPWHDPEAAYRLVFEQRKSVDPYVVDDRTLCLPESFAHGVKVMDEDGNLIPAKHYPSGGVLIPPVLRTEKRILYFGYAAEQKNGDYNPPGGNRRLCLTSGPGGRVADSPEDWKKKRLKKNEEKQAQLVKNTHYTVCSPKNCRKVITEYHCCHMTFLPFCARNPVYSEKDAPVPLWTIDPLRRLMTTCCRGLFMHPDYHRRPYDHTACVRRTNINILNRYGKSMDDIRKEADSVRSEDPEKSFENHLLGNLDEKRGGDPEFGRIFLTRRPFDTGDRSLIYYTGKLYAPEDGLYEFRVNANATRILKIDDEILMRQFGTANEKNTVTTGSVRLEKGLHRFLLCYLKKNIGTWLAASWKTPSSEQFSLLSEEDFMPGIPAEINLLESQSGLLFPLVRRDDKFLLFTGKLTRAGVHSFYSLNGDPIRFLYKGTEYPERENTFFLPGEKTVTDLLELKAEELRSDFAETGGDEAEIVLLGEGKSPLHIAPYPRPKTRAPIPLELKLKLSAPPFIYDDETLTGTLEIQSRLPFPFIADFRICADGVMQREKLRFSAHQLEDGNRFAQDLIYKRDFPLAEDETDFRLSVNGFAIDSALHASVQADEAVGFEWRDGAFYRESDGALMSIRLHRPNIRELRKWELVKTVAAGTEKRRKVLIVLDDFGDFQGELKRAFADRNMQCEFVCWSPENVSGGSPVPETLPEAAQALRSTDADSVLLIPPAQSRRKTHSLRVEFRSLAFLAEVAGRNPKVRSVVLTSCMPSNRFDTCLEEDRLLASRLRTLKREYGAAFLELNAALRTSAEKAARGELYPASLAKQAADFLAKGF